MTKKKNQAFWGGIPTDVDIKKLRDTYPENRLEPGQIIPYHEVERLLNERKDSHRWKGVTNRWRKIVEKETGIVIGVERGEGFKVLEEPEKVDLSGSKLRSSARAAKRSYEVGNLVNARLLSEEDRHRLDFYTVKSSKVIAASQVRQSKNNMYPNLLSQ